MSDLRCLKFRIKIPVKEMSSFSRKQNEERKIAGLVTEISPPDTGSEGCVQEETFMCQNNCTHNLSFAQKPFEVVLLDVHQAADIRDIKATVLHVVGL